MATRKKKSSDRLAPVRITKGQVDRLIPPKTGQAFLRDSELKGFIVRVSAGGTKTFCLEKYIKGRKVRRKIGKYPDLTVEQARKVAHVWLGQIAMGENPFELSDQKAREKLTLAFVLEDYLEARKDLRPRTAADYRQMVEKGLRDWRNLPLREITKRMVQQRHKSLGQKNGPHYANSTLRLLRALFNFAIAAYDNAEGKPLIAHNPVLVLTHTRAWYRKQRRRTVITRPQLPAWFQAVTDLRKRLKDPDRPEEGFDPEAALVSDYLLLVLFTGLRRNEAASLCWENVDFADKTLTIPDTKNGEPLTLPLSDFLVTLLQRRQKESPGTFVFPGPGKRGHLIEPKRQVKRVIKTSGVSFIIHDLRRTFITVADSLDLSHYAIKRLVNHKISGDVTAGYVVTNTERLREPMQRITDKLLEIVKNGDTVIQFPALRSANKQ